MEQENPRDILTGYAQELSHAVVAARPVILRRDSLVSVFAYGSWLRFVLGILPRNGHEGNFLLSSDADLFVWLSDSHDGISSAITECKQIHPRLSFYLNHSNLDFIDSISQYWQPIIEKGQIVDQSWLR